MTLQSAIEAELPFLRAEAEARMTSRATVRRLTGAKTTGPDGFDVPEWADVHIDLPFRSDSGSSTDGGSRTVVLGGVSYEQATGVGHFPAATADLADDDVLEITSGEWEGDFFRIVAAVRSDQKTARRVPIVEAQRPEGWA